MGGPCQQSSCVCVVKRPIGPQTKNWKISPNGAWMWTDSVKEALALFPLVASAGQQTVSSLEEDNDSHPQPLSLSTPPAVLVSTPPSSITPEHSGCPMPEQPPPRDESTNKEEESSHGSGSGEGAASDTAGPVMTAAAAPAITAAAAAVPVITAAAAPVITAAAAAPAMKRPRPESNADSPPHRGDSTTDGNIERPTNSIAISSSFPPMGTSSDASVGVGALDASPHRPEEAAGLGASKRPRSACSSRGASEEAQHPPFSSRSEEGAQSHTHADAASSTAGKRQEKEEGEEDASMRSAGKEGSTLKMDDGDEDNDNNSVKNISTDGESSILLPKPKEEGRIPPQEDSKEGGAATGMEEGKRGSGPPHTASRGFIGPLSTSADTSASSAMPSARGNPSMPSSPRLQGGERPANVGAPSLGGEEDEVLPIIGVYWGDARWSRTQLLGELARGSWGMCRGLSSDALPDENSTRKGFIDKRRNRLMKDIQEKSRPIYAPKSEMTEEYGRTPAPVEEDDGVLQLRMAVHREFLRRQLEEDDGVLQLRMAVHREFL